jgi:hypothetical protein
MSFPTGGPVHHIIRHISDDGLEEQVWRFEIWLSHGYSITVALSDYTLSRRLTRRHKFIDQTRIKTFDRGYPSRNHWDCSSIAREDVPLPEDVMSELNIYLHSWIDRRAFI